jgi:flagellar motor switch protein FliN
MQEVNGSEEAVALSAQCPDEPKLEQQVRSLDLILDIPMQVTVELGRTRMPIKEVIQLSQGSVIELSKLAGEHLEVFVNSKLVAKGEVVVVNEKFGVRISEVLSPAARVEQLA